MSSIFLKLLLTRELKMNTDKSKNITPIGISCLPIDWIENKSVSTTGNSKVIHE